MESGPARSYLQSRQDDFGYRGKVSVPEELSLLTEGQDPVEAHGPSDGRHLEEEEEEEEEDEEVKHIRFPFPVCLLYSHKSSQYFKSAVKTFPHLDFQSRSFKPNINSASI